jgi:hypothetical protein
VGLIVAVAASILVAPLSAGASTVQWTNTTSSSFAIGARCADVLFIGARGSGEAFEDDTGNLVDEGYGPMVETVRDGVRNELDPSLSVRQYALDYAATPIDKLADDFVNTVKSLAEFAGPAVSTFLESADIGVTRLTDVLEDSRARCPDEKWVLAGYSQGALAIHSALIDVAADGNSATRQLASTVLIADPARDSANTDAVPSVFHGTQTSGGKGVVTIARALGVLGFTASLDIYGSLGPLPPEVREKVIEVCNDGDVVCDTSRTMPAGHLLLLNALAWCTTLVDRAYDVHGHYGTDDPSSDGITAEVLAGFGSDAAAMVSDPVPPNRLNRETLEADLAVRREYLALNGRGQGL